MTCMSFSNSKKRVKHETFISFLFSHLSNFICFVAFVCSINSLWVDGRLKLKEVFDGRGPHSTVAGFALHTQRPGFDSQYSHFFLLQKFDGQGLFVCEGPQSKSGKVAVEQQIV